MPTKNPRLNITFEPDLASLLGAYAKQKHKSVSSLAKELILEALEYREDLALSRLAELRERENTKTHKHHDAWQ